MEISDTSSVVVPAATEDSVDIYEGLDIGIGSNAEGPSPTSSQLKESMDLYEDLVTEEQQSRDSSYTELESRFKAAQSQIKELHRRLEQVEMKNAGLSKENHSLKMNISALLRTARQELKRKDTEIEKLNQWADRSRHHQSHTSRLRDPHSSSQTSAVPSQCLVPPPQTSSLPQPVTASLSPTRASHSHKDLPQPTRKESYSLTKSSKESLVSHSKRETETADKHTEPDKHKSRDGDPKRRRHHSSESTDKRHRDSSDPSKDSCVSGKNRSHKADRDFGRRHDSRSCKSRGYPKEGHQRSDGAKTPPPETLHSAADNRKGCIQDCKKAKVKLLPSEHNSGTAHSPKDDYSRAHRKMKSSRSHDSHSNSKERNKSSSNQHYEPREKERDRQKDNQSTGDKGHQGEGSKQHRRSTQPETSREEGKRKVQNPERRSMDLHAEEKAQKAAKRPPKENHICDENSPNRKLCFMETLNLTISPIKKPGEVLPINKDGSGTDEGSQPDIEDLCVIDEVHNSELETQTVDGGDAAEASCQKDVKAKNLSPTGDTVLQTTSDPSQPLDSPVKHTAPEQPPAAKGPVGPFVKAADSSEQEARACQTLAVPVRAEPGTTPGVSEQLLQKGPPGKAPDGLQDAPQTAAAQSISPDSVSEPAVSSSLKEPPMTPDVAEKLQMPPSVPSFSCQQEPSPPSSTSFTHQEDCCGQPDAPKDIDTVSSTISLDSLPQEGLSLTEAIYVLTQTNADTGDSSTLPAEPTSSTGCIGVSKVSSTTEDKHSVPMVTPKKRLSPAKSQECGAQPSHSVPLLHDEDSMMHTLSNLQTIPDAISPLRSPVRIARRSLLHLHSKPGHVKSLQKDFSTPGIDEDSKKLDVNKENKYPGVPANRDAQHLSEKGTELTSGLSDTELEEGEILSESDEAASGSPGPPAKRAKLTQPVRHNASPASVLRRKSEERRIASKDTSEAAGASTQSPKSRFKTVCPSAGKAAFSSIEEIMDTFKLVRTEIRKKYMKLHKTFPRKSFYGVMDNFQKSFLEFVDGAHFGHVCSKADELKPKLRSLISSVFSKVLNNGIVKRIFEQQATDLKQKLWDFVDVQVDFLLRDIHTTLTGLCKAARAPAQDALSRGAEAGPQQLREGPSPPTSSSQPRSCALVPYRTGLGSRGKDIRITHAKKEPPNTQNPPAVDEPPSQKKLPPTAEKPNVSSLVVSQSGSVLDRADFELLTEQQASSLTFNLVRDSQMGEIFKCLLQGSDLLESAGDNTAWALGTPRKDGDRFFSIATPSKLDSPSKLMSPAKFESPSKLIATWANISPRRLLSPRLKEQVPLNPALLDESCLLEVPSENRALLQTSHRSYSILAEDLAVSLTIPSPLKSDSHLSFLQPVGTQPLSTPDSVLSAHISEDALMDGEDATEQDIHLALDTDNSSRGSISSGASEAPPTSFLFKPDVPMQALVMERSNDHFIVKIRQASADPDATLTAEDSLSCTLTEEANGAAQQSPAQPRAPPIEHTATSATGSSTGSSPPKNNQLHQSQASSAHHKAPKHPATNKSCALNEPLGPPQSTVSAKERAGQALPTHNITKEGPPTAQDRVSPSSAHCGRPPSENTHTGQQDHRESGSPRWSDPAGSCPDKRPERSRKRKKLPDRVQVKMAREEEDSPECSSGMEQEEPLSSPAGLSPSSLSAKNLVRKKGEVIAHRFYQLMKLFKRQEKMEP
ncbi:unnamed protein product [Menidia menidia]|uniref:(Atlantic silverside) hypothetical protein n=1 Tax=Menidia menidia TaxID=238744 RepID=A0A8S4B8U4_9TELE|nr:unnamed protein product [Menidia menidia]